MIDTLEKLVPLMTDYPRWFRYLVSASLIGIACLAVWILLHHRKTSISTSAPDDDGLNQPPDVVVERELEVPKAFKERFSDVLADPKAGMTKLLADGSKLESPLNGGGACWSFLRNTHKYGYGSDIQLSNSQFKTGLAGMNFGYFLRVGKTPIRQIVDTAGPITPNWIDEDRMEAWRYLWEYSPPKDIEEIRLHQSRARDFVVGNTTLSETVPAVVGDAYLLRSIMIGRWDILVAFEVVHKFDDLSLLIAWKVLRVFLTPIPTAE